MQLLVRLYSSANVHLSMLSYVFQIKIKIKSSFCSCIPKKVVRLAWSCTVMASLQFVFENLGKESQPFKTSTGLWHYLTKAVILHASWQCFYLHLDKTTKTQSTRFFSSTLISMKYIVLWTIYSVNKINQFCKICLLQSLSILKLQAL